jgi:hypothetical protein
MYISEYHHTMIMIVILILSVLRIARSQRKLFFSKNELGAMPHASGLQRCNFEHTCFGQGRAWINSIQCLATNFQPFRQLMLVVTFRQQALSLAFILDSLR